MPDIAAVAAPSGFIGALICMALYMLRAITHDRAAYREDLAEKHRRIERFRARSDAAEALVDTERALRRAAETEQARCRAELEGCKVRLRHAEKETARLRAESQRDNRRPQ